MDDLSWVIAKPKDKLSLTDLRKDQRRIESVAGLFCVLYLENANVYARDTMLEEGIPFIIEGKQIYMPFLGIMLSSGKARISKPVSRISFLTQKLILTALYDRWETVNVTKAASLLNVTKMSISRCFDEMEYLQIPVINIEGATRQISILEPVRDAWEEVKAYMISPVIRRFELTEDAGLAFKAGISALADLSSLTDNEFPVYGVTKKDLTGSGIKKIRAAGWQDEKKSIVLELGYLINFQGRGVMDPLSIMLSLTEEELEDARISSCVQEMLEEHVW